MSDWSCLQTTTLSPDRASPCTSLLGTDWHDLLQREKESSLSYTLLRSTEARFTWRSCLLGRRRHIDSLCSTLFSSDLCLHQVTELREVIRNVRHRRQWAGDLAVTLSIRAHLDHVVHVESHSNALLCGTEL